jgi:hypothetical protein
LKSGAVSVASDGTGTVKDAARVRHRARVSLRVTNPVTQGEM